LSSWHSCDRNLYHTKDTHRYLINTAHAPIYAHIMYYNYKYTRGLRK